MLSSRSWFPSQLQLHTKSCILANDCLSLFEHQRLETCFCKRLLHRPELSSDTPDFSQDLTPVFSMAHPDARAPLAARTLRNSPPAPRTNAGTSTPQRPRQIQTNPPYTPPAHHYQQHGKLHRQRAQLSGVLSNAMRNEIIAFIAEFWSVHTCLGSSSSTS